MINLSLTTEQQILSDSIIKFAEQELNDNVLDRDRSSEFRRDLWAKCGEYGLHGLPVPEKLGGMGLDSVSLVVALEALGYASKDSGLNFSICAHLLACVIPVWRHGSSEMHASHLAAMCTGDLIAVNAMTEATTGSDAFAMSTQAVPVDGGYLINGTKTFNSNAPVADVALVYASTNKQKKYMGGSTAFLVDCDTAGFDRGQTFEKLGLRTSQIGELVFTDMFVSSERVVGKVGGGGAIFTESMDWERACVAAVHVGTMRRILEICVEYARTRKQFDQPIGKNQAVSHKIADMKVRLEASRMLVYKSALALGESSSASMDASVTKVFVSEALLQSALDAVQIHGGNGFMVEYEVERILRDAVGAKIYSGTNEMQRNIIAHWLGL